jgi:nucleotide-binding universal stress UspA family protein
MKTKKMKSVLIALDYNPTSQRVAEFGYTLAKSMDAEVTLLHVMVSPAIYATAYGNMEAWQSEAVNTIKELKSIQTASEKFLKKAKLHLADDSIQTIQKEGDFAQLILDTAIEMNADCIVMGSHSQKWLENIVMGSVTQEVLRKSTIPLFIVPTKKRE